MGKSFSESIFCVVKTQVLLVQMHFAVSTFKSIASEGQ